MREGEEVEEREYLLQFDVHNIPDLAKAALEVLPAGMLR